MVVVDAKVLFIRLLIDAGLFVQGTHNVKYSTSYKFACQFTVSCGWGGRGRGGE